MCSTADERNFTRLPLPQALCPSCREPPLKPVGIRCFEGCRAVTEPAQRNAVTAATEMVSGR